jgi:hypothetical protein
MKKLFSILVVASLFALSGCGAKNDENAAKDIQESIVNLSGVQSGKFVAEVSGDLTGNFGVETEDVSFSAELSGAYDNGERENPTFSFKIDGEADVPEVGAQSLDAEIRLSDGQFYFVLNDISDFGGQLPTALISPFLGQWFFMELPADYSETLAAYSGDESEMTEEEVALKELFKNTVLFSSVKNMGGEDVDGDSTTRYYVELDKDAFATYLVESAKIVGEEMTEQDLTDLREGLEYFDFSGDIWISDDSATFKKLAGTLTLNDVDGVSGDLSIAYTVNDIGETIEVAIPEGAEEFDPLALMGAAGSF